MKRRDWIAAAGTVAAAALPRRARAQAPPPRRKSAGVPDGLETEVVRLRLRHTWTTTMSSSGPMTGMNSGIRSIGLKA